MTDDAAYQGQLGVDPGHDFSDVFFQMYGRPFDGTSAGSPDMSGFVRSYEQQAGAGQGAEIIRCFRPELLPALTTSRVNMRSAINGSPRSQDRS